MLEILNDINPFALIIVGAIMGLIGVLCGLMAYAWYMDKYHYGWDFHDYSNRHTDETDVLERAKSKSLREQVENPESPNDN